jgi:tyrosyl-tRNA synthetase
MIQAGGVSVNKIKTNDINTSINSNDLLNNKYLLVQKGKKNYFLIRAH